MTTTKVESRNAKVESQHTPGPWRNNGGQIESVEGWGPIESLGGLPLPHIRVVATVGIVNEQTRQDTANARLIAAAPDLLAELQFVLDRAEEMGCNCATVEQVNRGHNRDCPANQKNGLFKAARSAIIKAEGRTQ